MSSTTADRDEYAVQNALLTARIGQAGSGAMRYGAAMYFYTQNLMPAEMLEIYRRCSVLDHEDPIDVARYEGVTVPPMLKRDS